MRKHLEPIFATLSSGVTSTGIMDSIDHALSILVAIATLAWWLRIWLKNPAVKPPNMAVKEKKSGKLVPAVLIMAAILVPGCARFSTKQTDLTFEDGKPLRQITTKAAATTFAASKATLAQWKASQTDKSQGASVGGLSQEADATALTQAIAAGIVEGLAKTMKPVP